MLVTLSGIVKLVRLVQKLNPASPMLVTPSCNVTLARLLQTANDPIPKLVMLPGIVMLELIK
jgi:hypothetical protein